MDRGAGLGGEDRRPHGGAVSFSGIVRRRRTKIFVSALVTVSFLTGCSRRQAKAAPDAITQLQAVTPADPAKLPHLGENKHWSNPYLVIGDDSVRLLTDIAPNEEQKLKPEEVLKTLAQLPGAAWPYGRAVAILVDAKLATSEQEKISLRRNRGIVAGELQTAHVAIVWIPSA
jgi:hypothetical protein